MTALPQADRTLVMGVVNVTPDSFSDGGRWFEPDDAVKHGLALLAEGADLLDVGGESTRPGASRVAPEEEQRRVIPVIRALADAGGYVSVDTTHSAVAEAALHAGAQMVNDVSGGTDDADLPRLAGAAGVPYVVMHSCGRSDATPAYRDVVAEVIVELRRRVDGVRAAGVAAESIVVDPGFGFAKSALDNLAVLAALPRLMTELQLPLLVGTSRKRFLGSLLADRAVDDRDDATQATTTLAAWHGAWAVRVHAVRPAADAVRVVAAIRAGGS